MLYNRTIRIIADTMITAGMFFAVSWHVNVWAAIAVLAFGLWNYWDGLTRRLCE